MRKPARIAPLLLLSALAGYLYWAQLRPSVTPLVTSTSEWASPLAANQGRPGERGNLLGIQPELFPQDYQSPAHLRHKLATYLQQARDQGVLNEKTVAVLPEHIGTWLVASDEKNALYHAQSLNEAMAWLAASNPVALVQALFAAQGEERLSDALFRMKAAQMARDYQAVFGGLAKEFEITLVAGSIVLPAPEVIGEQLIAGDGPLFNVSQVFARDGRPLGQPQRKVYPIRDEQGFTAASAEQLHSVETPAGRLGVLICADSWYPAGYQQLAEQKVDLIAVPAFLTGNGNWSKPWGGYNGAATPADVQLKPGELSEGQAWQRLSMPGRLNSSGAAAGITVFMRGQLWDMGSDGHSLLSNGSHHSAVADGKGARLANIWL